VNETTIYITVPPGKKKERIDVFLAHQVENASRSKVQIAIKKGYVLVNDKPVKANHIVAPGELITVTLPKPPPPEAEPEPIPLHIIYEDDAVIVLDKPAGMVTHPAYGNYRGTLVNALLAHTASNEANRLASTGDPLRPGIIHRLDKDTSGLLVVAKNDRALRFIAKQFADRTIDREYWAIVWGNMKERSGEIEAPLGRSKSDRKKIAVRLDGKPARTRYEVLEEYDGLSLIRLRLHTGRTHQIRVHLASIHHPVFGDASYGGRRIVYGSVTPKRKLFIQNMLERLPRQALHAKTLGFMHPVTRERLFFESDLPGDMEFVITQLRKNTEDMQKQ
jgi:23S rRNA pseudouridine1911/1915/1917 synthase